MTEKEMMNRRIESQMALAGLNLKELSESLGLSYEACRQKCLGVNPWKDTEIIMMAKLFKVSTDYILTGDTSYLYGGDNNGEL